MCVCVCVCVCVCAIYVNIYNTDMILHFKMSSNVLPRINDIMSRIFKNLILDKVKSKINRYKYNLKKKKHVYNI